MRCRACNKILEEWELMPKDEEGVKLEDMCQGCIGHSYDALYEMELYDDSLEDEVVQILEKFQELKDDSKPC